MRHDKRRTRSSFSSRQAGDRLLRTAPAQRTARPALKNIGPESSQLLSDLSIATFVQAYQDVHSWQNIQHYCRRHYSEAAAKKTLQRDDIGAVVAFAGAQPAGFYVLRHRRCPPAPGIAASELKQIYVLAAHYGSGLGRQLFEHAVSAARNRGSERLWLCVSNANLRAQAFYRKLGFAVVGDGPALEVGTDTLPSTILELRVCEETDESPAP
ncbi:MAG: GNAT family N-acetyltransferase [Pseudomonadota bacterium]